MTEPINIGNVKFSRNDVKSYTVNIQNDEKINSVLVRDGTRLTFNDQDENNGARVNRMGREDYEYAFFKLKGLTIEGSERNDKYSLYNCEDYNIDTRGGNKDKISIINSNNGTIRADENDTIRNSTIRRENNISNEYYPR